jgi:hypothetical protein
MARDLTWACTRPRTRRLSCISIARARRVMPGVRLLYLSEQVLMSSYLRLFFTALILNSVPTSIVAQDTRTARPVVIGKERGTDGAHCEDTMAALDLIARYAKGGGAIIMVSRLGRGESCRNLAWLRLRGLGAYLYDRRGVAPGRVVMAEGERAAGLGVVEVYIGGELHTVFHLKRSKEFLRGCGV